MPSEHSPGASRQQDYADPAKQTAARWLDRDLQTPGDTRQEEGFTDDGFPEMQLVPDDDVTSEWPCVQSVIETLDDAAEIRAWIGVENDLGRDDGAARERVINALVQRLNAVEMDDAPTPRRVGPVESTASTVQWTDREDNDRGSTYMQSSHDAGTDAQAHLKVVVSERYDRNPWVGGDGDE